MVFVKKIVAVQFVIILSKESADSYIVVYVFLGYFSSFLYLIYDSDGKKPRNAAVRVSESDGLQHCYS